MEPGRNPSFLSSTNPNLLPLTLLRDFQLQSQAARAGRDLAARCRSWWETDFSGDRETAVLPRFQAAGEGPDMLDSFSL